MVGQAIPGEKFNFGQIFDFSFIKETEASYRRRRDLPSINFENLKEEE